MTDDITLSGRQGQHHFQRIEAFNFREQIFGPSSEDRHQQDRLIQKRHAREAKTQPELVAEV